MDSKSNHPKNPINLKAFLKTPKGIASMIAAGCILLLVAIALVLVMARANAALPDSSLQDSSGAATVADDASYDADALKVNKSEFEGTILPLTKDAGQAYLDETLFLGDSNTARYMVYGPDDATQQHFTTIQNNIGVVSMGVTAITSLKCEQFKGYASEVTMPEAVKIMQPQRVIIGFGTNNLTMDTQAFIDSYKKGLAAIAAAYPYADIIVNAIPPLDQQRENTALSMKQVDAKNAAIAAMCAAEGYKYLDSSEALEDASTGWAKKDYTISDGVHLSKEGVRALFDYIRTHAFITEDTRPKPLKAIPTVVGVTPGLITNDPLAVRGAKIPVEFVATEGGYIEGTKNQSVKEGLQTSAVTAKAEEGWVFAGWTATVGHVDQEQTIQFTMPSGVDANGVVITALFKRAATATPAKCICKPDYQCEEGDVNWGCPVCSKDYHKCWWYSAVTPSPSPSPSPNPSTPPATESPTEVPQVTESPTEVPQVTESPTEVPQTTETPDPTTNPSGGETDGTQAGGGDTA